jgi:hypothetical protein
MIELRLVPVSTETFADTLFSILCGNCCEISIGGWSKLLGVPTSKIEAWGMGEEMPTQAELRAIIHQVNISYSSRNIFAQALRAQAVEYLSAPEDK